MFGFTIAIHTIVCIILIAVILMQSGRGGGLTEGFASAESLFGAKTNAVMVRATAILASLYLLTCLSLSFLSIEKNKSLMESAAVTHQQKTSTGEPATQGSSSGVTADTKVPQDSKGPENTETLKIADPGETTNSE